MAAFKRQDIFFFLSDRTNWGDLRDLKAISVLDKYREIIVGFTYVFTFL